MSLHFQALCSFEKACFVLGSELWEYKYGSMLDLVKSYILHVWELRKVRLYGDTPSFQQSQSQIAPGVLLVGVSCVWKVRQTLVLVCVPLLYVILGYVCVLCVHFLLAPPILIGAWSMALVLWRPPKYY